MNSRTPILRVSCLEVRYARDESETLAVRDVSFSLARNETFGLVGESGSGKSTVALAVVAHLPENGRISRGTIWFDGVDLLNLTGRELRRIWGRRIAMVYQDPAAALNPSMRVGEQIAEVFTEHLRLSRRAALERAIEMMERVRVADAPEAYRRYPHEFSGGQKQRIVIAMALAASPDLLVLDEPTSSLDKTVEAEILTLVSELRGSVQAGIVFISHDIGLVGRMSDRVGVMYAGQLVEVGPTCDVLKSPRHPYTRALVSCRVPVGASKRDVRLQTIGATPSDPRVDLRGCSFAVRCDFVQSRCRGEAPDLLPVGRTRWSRCFFPDEVGRAKAAVQKSDPDMIAPQIGGSVLLELRDISKAFRLGKRELAAVVNVSLQVKEGEVLGIVGESGSGKTTLARIVAGLEAADRGISRFGGVDITRSVTGRPHGIRRAIQMVFQNPDATLNPRHRVGRILRRTLAKLAGLRGEELKVRTLDAMDAVQLERQLLGALPENLSGGQKQRVAIARAFVAGPRLIICDEPTSALDVSVQATILNLLIELQSVKRTSYIFISHDLAAVRYIADQIAVMYLGKVVEVGPAARVFAPPFHPYTEMLMLAAGWVKGGGAEQKRQTRLAGVTSSIERPRGCAFHPRCPRKVGPICEEDPPWQSTEEGHKYCCVIHPHELKRLQMAEPLSGPVASVRPEGGG